MTRIVEIENLIFRWKKQETATLNIKNFYIAEGEQVFLYGKSGSGKSTLLRLMAGILVATEGSLKVLNKELKKMKSNERDFFRGQHIGFIFQQFNLIPYLSALENVVLASTFSNRMNLPEAEKVAKNLLKNLDLTETTWHQRASDLSVGQQQRVACARALIGNPQLIIADEPTSALDAERQQAFLDLLMAECKRSKITLLFVSHDKRLAENFTRKIELNEISL